MDFLSGLPLTLLGDATAASNSMRSFVMPLLGSIIGIAAIAVVFFLVNAGYQYMTSSNKPERLEHAKRVIRNALIGLFIVVGAATLTAVLNHAYSAPTSTTVQNLPALTTIDVPGSGITDVLMNAIVEFMKKLVESAAKPFLSALSFFTDATPLMADNSAVFNLWLVMVAIANVLFIVVVALLGFHVMSYATFGLEEIEFKHLLPRIALGFLLINTSIFAIDAIISLSNAMIAALNAGFSGKSVWETLIGVTSLQSGLSIAGLLIMVTFLVLSVMLLIYYVLRLVVLCIGAVLSPIVFLIWLLPPFKEFAETAMKTYLMTIFVLFIHVVILQLAAGLFASMVGSDPNESLNPLMSMIVGIATVLSLLKTQSVLSQMTYMSVGPKTATKLGGQLVNVISHYGSKGGSTKLPEGLSRSGVERGARKSGIFNKSGTSVISRPDSRGRTPALRVNIEPSSKKLAAKLPTSHTEVAPKIQRTDK